jgi:hypothetical protein
MTSKKPSAPATTARLRSACPYCEALERQYDDAVGHIRLKIDESFRDRDGNIGFNFENRQWPHGWKGSGSPHGAVFSR